MASNHDHHHHHHHHGHHHSDPSSYASSKPTSLNSGSAESEFRNSWNKDFGYGANDRRFVQRQGSFKQAHEPRTPVSIFQNDSKRPFFSRSVSSIDIPSAGYALEEFDNSTVELRGSSQKLSVFLLVSSVFRLIRSGNRPIKRLFIMISLNVAYSTAELFIGLLSGRVGLVSDAFHLTFGCGLLTFSLFAMAASRTKHDRIYTYGYSAVTSM